MTYLPPSLRLAGLPLALAVGACASAAPGPSLLPAGWTPPTGQHCKPAGTPKRLPTLGELTDSAALVRRLAGQTGHGLFMVGYDSLGMADTVRFVGGDLPGPARPTWLQAVAASVRERSPLPLPTERGKAFGWSVVLRVDGGSPATARIGRSEDCAPVLSNRLAAETYMNDAAATFLQRYPVHARPTRVVVQMRVDTAGRVIRATALRREAVPELTRIAEETALRMQFLPARLNRIPVEFTVFIPLTFQFARRR